MATAPGETLVIAHRGASDDFPENTVEAFEEAARVGADMIELDVRRTADGHLIAYHDPTGAYRHDELTAVRTSSRPPLVADVLRRFAGRIGLDIELKERGYEAEVVRMVRRSEPERCVITSFLDDAVRDVKALAPELEVGLVVGRPRAGDAVARARRAGADWLVLEAGLPLSPDLPCLVWTVNDAPAIDRCLREPAVAGVITDRPALALARRGLLSARTGLATPSRGRGRPVRGDAAAGDTGPPSAA